jgi:phosphopantetheine adenylyltransferase
MKDYKQLIKELPAKSVVFAFGRFNPPTIGHELLVKAVKKLAQQRNADHVIYASRSQDAKKNPLSVEKKVKYLKLMFKSTNFAAANDQERTFIEAAKALNKKYKNIIMIAGSDRIAEFKRLLNTYNGKEFNFDTIEVVSAGERDPDADDATGMSASKMRSLAVKGSYSEFKKGLPSSVRDIDGKRLMNDIRDGMGLEPIKEQIILVKDELREKFFRGEIFNEGDIVESAGERFTIVKRGSNHLLLKEASGNLVSKWIQDVQPTEEKEDMNEALTDKTLRPNDKIKVARIIATMLGVDNAETSSNPENLINQALRKVRTKALNPEALHILDKMLNLATEQGIQYDATLKPSKLKEGAMQIGGTDKIETPTDSVVVNKNSKYNFAKDILRFNDFKKLQKMQEHEESESDDKKDNESDHDYEHQVQITDPTEVGHTLVGAGKQDNLRRRKIKYHLGEQHKIPHVDMTSYGDEAGHENTAQHIATNPEHTAKQKKLAKSFLDKMQGMTEQKDKAALETAKANLMAKHAREKESLADKHAREKESLKEEHIVHVDDGSNYGDKPHPKDVEHVNAGVKKHGGEFDGHSDKGAYFKFKSQSDAKNFADHVKKSPHKSVYADLHEEVQICETAEAGLAAKAEKSGVSIGTLRKVYRRGVAAWNSGHRPGTTPQQWGMARVNSYITKGKGTYHGADKDLREEELQEKKLPEVPKDKESGLPKKYVAGLSDATAKARAAHWDKMDKKSDSDPSAYEPAPGDATAKTKPSKHTLKYRAMFNEDMDEELYEACWDTHKQIGMKKKGNRMVPDCVPKNEETEVCPVCGKSPCECEKPTTGPVATDKPFDAMFKEDEDEFDFPEPSDDEIESMADELSDDDYLDTYEEDELGIVDDETGEELPEDEEEEKKLKESALMEVLSRIERMKAKARIRRTSAKRERATKIALKRYSNTATINKRARRLAIKLMKKRLLRGRDPSKVSVGEKERIERTLEKRKAVIGRIATRLAPRVRKVEKARLSHTKYTQGSQPSVF